MAEPLWPRWACSYEIDGKPFCLTIPARTHDEAQRRLRAIGMTGKVDGELMAVIPANVVTLAPLGLAVSLTCWAQNLLGSIRRWAAQWRRS